MSMKTLLHCLLVIAVSLTITSIASAVVFTEWDYNAYTNPGNASIGTGTTVGSFFPFNTGFPDSSGSSADPGTVVVGGTGACVGGCLNNSNATKTGPQPTDPSGNRTLDFLTSSAGYTDIAITWDMVAGYRTSRYYQIYATTDGTTFNPVSGGVGTGASTAGVGSATVDSSGLITVIFDDGYNPDPSLDPVSPVDYLNDLSYAFASGSAMENNPNFGVRIAAVWGPGNSAYVSSFSGEENGATSGKGYTRESHPRYDLVQISGTAIPEPTSIVLAMSCFSLALIGRRR